MKKAAIVTLLMITIAGTALAEEEMLFHGRVTQWRAVWLDH